MQRHFRIFQNFLILALTTLVVLLSGLAQVPGLQRPDASRSDQAIQGLFEDDLACCYHKVHLQQTQKQLSRKANFYNAPRSVIRLAARHAARPFSSSIPDEGNLKHQPCRAPPVQLA